MLSKFTLFSNRLKLFLLQRFRFLRFSILTTSNFLDAQKNSAIDFSIEPFIGKLSLDEAEWEDLSTNMFNSRPGVGTPPPAYLPDMIH